MCIILIMTTLFLILQPQNRRYIGWMDSPTYRFNRDWKALVWPTATFIFYLAVFYHQEPLLFSNLDLMSNLNTDIFKNGVFPIYGEYGRVRPMGFWENNILYAITENMYVLNIYVCLAVLIFMYMLYWWLEFIPVGKRLTIIGTVILIPAYFWLNNLIFNEKTWLIEIVGSLICLRHFIRNNRRFALIGFVLLMNMAIYSKETVSLFYFGILTVMGLEAIFDNKIVVKDFLRPLRLLRRFPVELMILVSLLLFFIIFHLNVYAPESSNYLNDRRGDWWYLCQIYRFELAISLIATIILVNRIRQRHFNVIAAGIVAGCFMTLLYLIRIGLVIENCSIKWRSYYLVTPAVFLTIYVLGNIKNRAVYYVVVAILVLYSLGFNLSKINIEEGTSYRKVGDFIASQLAENKPMNVYMARHSESNIWRYSVWANVYKYYFPTHEVRFKIYQEDSYENELTLIYYQDDEENYHPLLPTLEVPQRGDFYIVRKNKFYQEDMAVIGALANQMVHQNKLFEIYQILP